MLVRTASMRRLLRRFYRVPTIYVLSKNKKKYHNFPSENYHFTAVKTCSVLNGRVCVMLVVRCLDNIYNLSLFLSLSVFLSFSFSLSLSLSLSLSILSFCPLSLCHEINSYCCIWCISCCYVLNNLENSINLKTLKL